MTKKVSSENVVDGVKLSAPIKSVIDKNQVTKEYTIDDEENEDYPPSMVKKDEETKGDEFTEGDGKYKLDALVIFKKLGLEDPKPNPMKLTMVDHFTKRLVGVLFDILFKVQRFIFLSNFVVLDCNMDIEVPIILG
ncbi:hypothetical protein H5410_051114 [Solanum commersonii]|uniref:Uncharacterized protein n=1 Tax=Solanum commersonii TaxID=4109 RepID=A0A9J5WYN4_SOLCO|nr:hypothetical protein H5410_051114 [Solanum commersonii]